MAEIVKGIPFDANEIVITNDVGEQVVTWDHILYAQDFATWWATYFSNGILVPKGGVLDRELKVIETDDANTIQVRPGNLIVNGRTAFVSKAVNLKVPVSTDTQIDRVVMQLDLQPNVNNFELLIRSGNANEPPALLQSEDIYEVSLARLIVDDTGVVQIIDERYESELCGISQVQIGVKPPAEPLAGSAAALTYDDRLSRLVNGGDTSVQKALETFALLREPIVLEDTVISMGDWVETNEYAKTPFRARISNIYGVTSDMTADVYFSPEDADSGLLSGSGKVDNNTLTLYASQIPAHDIVIPHIKIEQWYRPKQSNLNNLSWEGIKTIASYGLAPQVFEIGDEKELELSTGETIIMQIAGFGIDQRPRDGLAAITFIAKAPMQTIQSINTTATNSGGWPETEIRAYLNNVVFDTLPPELRTYIVAVNKRSYKTANTPVTTTDKLFLLAEAEVFDELTYSLGVEGDKYPIFTDADSRIKSLQSYWWALRSRGSDSGVFCAVNGIGQSKTAPANSDFAIVFGFCI